MAVIRPPPPVLPPVVALMAASLGLACGVSEDNSPKNSRGWSPDGTRLVFFLPWDGEPREREIFVVHRDGTGLTDVTCNDVEDANPAWSPEGRWIAFFTSVNGWLQVAVMRPDGTGRRVLTEGPAHNHSPEWSPDGRELLFESNHGGVWDLHLLDIVTNGRTRLTDTPYRDGRPSWSADPNRILFYSDIAGNEEIYVMDRDSLTPTRLTDHPASDFNPSWDHNGGVLFVSDRDGDSEIFRLRIDKTLEQLTHNAAADWNPHLAPDGRAISFSSDRDGGEGLYLMDPDGSHQRPIASPEAIDRARHSCRSPVPISSALRP